ncbi:MAG: hypothetical protein LBD79_04110 [Treponema sp.]|nr:hypothetical protein [Treponema sp.]
MFDLLFQLCQTPLLLLEFLAILLFPSCGIADFLVKRLVFPLGVNKLHLPFGVFAGTFCCGQKVAVFRFKEFSLLAFLILLYEGSFESGQHFFLSHENFGDILNIMLKLDFPRQDIL